MRPKTMRIASEGSKSLPKRVSLTGPIVDVAGCPAGKDRCWIYDKRQPGLALMITATGAKSFYIYRKVAGRPQRIRLGGFPDITIEEARKLTSKKIADIANGINPMAEKREAKARGMTVGELFTWFIDNWAKPRKRSWKDDQNRYDNHLKPWASRQLADITAQDVAALHQRIGTSTSHATANRVLALLSTAFNKAASRLNYVGGNPCKGVEKFAEASRERFLSADELARFFKALDSGTVIIEDFRDIFKLALFTGARRGNVLSMRWDELDLKAGTWSIPGSKFKNKMPVVIHLADPAIDVLKARAKAGEWVFPGNGKSKHLVKPETAWKALCEAADLKDVRIHDLRRTLGSWQAAGNTSLAIIGKSLGHRSQTTTAIYARLQLDPVKASVNAATAAMIAAAKTEKTG